MSLLSIFILIVITVLIIIVIALGAYLVYPLIQRNIEWQRRAAHDYEAARGTQHRRMLEQSLAVLRSKIATREASIEYLKQNRATLQQRQTDELDRALLQQELVKIHGISHRLAEQIEQQAYRGDLRNLQYASRVVNGIGEKKQAALNAWLKSTYRKWPSMRSQDFQGKSAIAKRYAARSKQLEGQLFREEQALREMQAVVPKAASELNRLHTVSQQDFLQALKQSPSGNSDQINAYLIGVFAEWEEMPDWFKSLITKYPGA